ncbi:MAG: LCP family protein [Pyramidobacter sp.]|jgi:LCP family protein required for cell wall assembly
MRRGSVLLTVLIALSAFAIGVALRLYSLVNTDVDEIKHTMNFDRQHGTVNVLVLGIDDVESVHRSDTIILARVDIDKKTASVMSIPRDTRVTIKGRKQPQKINHAYAFGGIELLRDTVVNLTGIPVNYYLIVNYGSFPKIVDAIGGVDIDVTKSMKYTDKAQGLYIDFSPGMQHMDGEAALRYVRFRYDAMGDMGRMKRQQEFTRIFINKLASPAVLPRVPELIQSVLSEIKTDIPVKTALQLAGQLKDMKPSQVRFFTMPGSPAYIGGISYFVADLQKASTLMDPNYSPDAKEKFEEKGDGQFLPLQGGEQSTGSTLGGELTAESGRNSDEDLAAIVSGFKKPIAVLNGTGRAGLAKTFTELFEKAGIEVAFTGNAKHYDYRYCLVHYSAPENLELARNLAHLCGISEGLVRKADISYPAALILGKNNSQHVMERLKALTEKAR